MFNLLVTIKDNTRSLKFLYEERLNVEKRILEKEAETMAIINQVIDIRSIEINSREKANG